MRATYKKTMTQRRKVLITGAAGHVGQVLASAWRGVYELTLVDIRSLERTDGANAIVADLREVGIEHRLCAGMDTVVHLAISGNLYSPRAQLAPVNMDAARRIMEAAVEAGCRRLVFASSLSILLYPNTDYSRAKLETEGWAEAWAESSALSIHCLRLGWVVASTNQALWPGCRDIDYVLTHEDLVRLFTASIESSPSVHFGIYDGVSRQAGPLADLTPAHRELHFLPIDNAHELAHRNTRTPRGIARRIKRWLRRSWASLGTSLSN